MTMRMLLPFFASSASVPAQQNVSSSGWGVNRSMVFPRRSSRRAWGCDESRHVRVARRIKLGSRVRIMYVAFREFSFVVQNTALLRVVSGSRAFAERPEYGTYWTMPSTPNQLAVCVRGLRKAYSDVVAVDGLDLAVGAGECFGLLGPNGAGKTTTIEICEGLLAPDAGTVELLRMRWDSDARELRQRLGVQLQETQLSE